MNWELEDLVSPSDIADMFAVNPTAVSNWQQRHDDFPQPLTAVARGKTALWSRRQVMTWYKNRFPGRLEERIRQLRVIEAELAALEQFDR